jgi:hypothetical protein
MLRVTPHDAGFNGANSEGRISSIIWRAIFKRASMALRDISIHQNHQAQCFVLRFCR